MAPLLILGEAFLFINSLNCPLFAIPLISHYIFRLDGFCLPKKMPAIACPAYQAQCAARRDKMPCQAVMLLKPDPRF